MKVGVVIGRWQTSNLHKGHLHVLDTADKENDELIILIGVSPVSYVKYNPLDYETRKFMLMQEFPNATVLPCYDKGEDTAWSKQIDYIISKEFPKAEFTLYGGRDSSLGHYEGICFKREITDYPAVNESSTKIRSEIASFPSNIHTKEFREGAIYAVEKSFPRIVPTVDIAPVFADMLLLGRKPERTKWVFPGGFVDLEDECLEQAALRELSEEVKGLAEILDKHSLHYVCSRKVNDYRYKKYDTIHTTLFLYNLGNHTWNNQIEITAGDDLEEVKFFTLREAVDVISDNHRELLYALLNHLRVQL